DGFDFFYKSSSQYRRVGYGANINGFDTPLPMNSFDVLYHFPLNYNDNDSCDADFSLTLPNVLYYGYNAHRVNLADGWGTLITPFGTFNTLRVKSTIAAHDSINIITSGIGFGIDRPLATEYKWIGKNKSIPLLQINTADVFGVETVTSIIYQDSARVFPTGVIENIDQAEIFSIYPNPAKNNFAISMSLKSKSNVCISIYNSEGKRLGELLNESFNAGKIIKIFNKHSIGVSEGGFYLIRIDTGGKNYYKKLTLSD